MSAKTIDYYFTPMSPWAYLGHERFVNAGNMHEGTSDIRI